MNLYLQGFLESAWTASIVPLGSEPAFTAMKAFGGYNMALAFVLATLGATLGHAFNWLAGTLLLNLKNKNTLTVSPYWYDRAALLFNKYGLFLLLFAWVPLGNLLVVLAGFIGLKLRRVLPLVFAGVAIHYGLALLL